MRELSLHYPLSSHGMQTRNWLKLSVELEQQDILLPAAGVGGALEFMHTVRSINRHTRISVSETDTLMYACVVPEIGHSHINEEKRSILCTSLADERGFTLLCKGNWHKHIRDGK